MYIVGITFVFILLKQRRRGRHARARRVYCIGSNLIGFDDPSRSHACRLAFAAASHSALFTVPGNTPTRTRTRQYTSHTIHFIHFRASSRVAHRRHRRRRRSSSSSYLQTHSPRWWRRNTPHRRRKTRRARRSIVQHSHRSTSSSTTAATDATDDRAPLSRRSIEHDPIRSRDIVTIEPGGERVLCARSMCEFDRTRDPGDRIDGTPNVRIAAFKRPTARAGLSVAVSRVRGRRRRR